MKKRFRIITDAYAGFEVQAWRWWFPIWLQCDFTNTHTSKEQAEAYIKKHKRVVVETLH